MVLVQVPTSMCLARLGRGQPQPGPQKCTKWPGERLGRARWKPLCVPDTRWEAIRDVRGGQMAGSPRTCCCVWGCRYFGGKRKTHTHTHTSFSVTGPLGQCLFDFMLGRGCFSDTGLFPSEIKAFGSVRCGPTMTGSFHMVFQGAESRVMFVLHWARLAVVRTLWMRKMSARDGLVLGLGRVHVRRERTLGGVGRDVGP